MMYNIIMDISEQFSSNLTYFRKLRGYSQRSLAKTTGLSLRMVNHYENNPKSVPFESLKILADTLKIQITDLFSDNDKKEKIENLDIRWVKKVIELKNLSPEDRREINKHIDYLVSKSKGK